MPLHHAPADVDCLAKAEDGRTAGRSGLVLALGFWIVITGLLAARVALFDEITAARVAALMPARVASLLSVPAR